jgi:hypothetical protein
MSKSDWFPTIEMMPYRFAGIRTQIDNRDMPYALALLHRMYEADKAKLVIREMTDLLVLDLVDKGLVTD